MQETPSIQALKEAAAATMQPKLVQKDMTIDIDDMQPYDKPPIMSKLNMRVQKYFPPVRLHKIKIPYKIPKLKTDAEKKKYLFDNCIINTEPHTMEEAGIGQINSKTDLDLIDRVRETPELPDSVYTQRAKGLIVRKKKIKSTNKEPKNPDEPNGPYQTFDLVQCLKSFQQYGEERGATLSDEELPHLNNKSSISFASPRTRQSQHASSTYNARSMKSQQQSQKPKHIQTKSFDVKQAVDPLYGIRSLADDSFVNGYSKKWGAEKAIFTPIRSEDRVMTFDSHTTLSKLDQRKVNAILDRNVNLYYRYAVNKLDKIDQQRSSQAGISHMHSSMVGSPQEKGLCMLQDSLQSDVYEAQVDGTFQVSTQKNSTQKYQSNKVPKTANCGTRGIGAGKESIFTIQNSKEYNKTGSTNQIKFEENNSNANSMLDHNPTMGLMEGQETRALSPPILNLNQQEPELKMPRNKTSNELSMRNMGDPTPGSRTQRLEHASVFESSLHELDCIMSNLSVEQKSIADMQRQKHQIKKVIRRFRQVF